VKQRWLLAAALQRQHPMVGTTMLCAVFIVQVWLAGLTILRGQQ